jgi:hypothetical protein
MTRLVNLISLLGSVWIATCAISAAQASDSARTLARYPSPTFLENLYVAADDMIYVTNYTGRGIERIAPGKPAERFVNLTAHPVSLLASGDGFVVAVHGASFVDGPAFIGSGRLLRLDRQGTVIKDIPARDAGMLNGMVQAPDGAILIADSIKGQILRFDPGTDAVSVWFSDPVLIAQTTPHFLPGANGLKFKERSLYVSSSATRSLYRLAIQNDRPVGSLEKVVELQGADDFIILPEGGYVVATHGDRVVKVDATGNITPLTTDVRVRGNTAVGVIGSGSTRKAVVLGTGGFSEGGKDDATVLAIPLPQQ